MGMRTWLTNLSEASQVRLLNVQLDRLFRSLRTSTKNETGEGELVAFPLAIQNGGTGATTANDALKNLGAAPEEHEHPREPIVFSSEEIYTGKVFVSGGKEYPVYSKTLMYTIAKADTTESGPAIEGFGELFDLHGSFYYPDSGYYHQLNFYRTSSDFNYAYFNTSGVLRVRSASKGSIVTAFVEYTKK